MTYDHASSTFGKKIPLEIKETLAHDSYFEPLALRFGLHPLLWHHPRFARLASLSHRLDYLSLPERYMEKHHFLHRSRPSHPSHPIPNCPNSPIRNEHAR